MFIPTNIDKVSIQATHIESSKGKHAREDKNPFKFEKKLKGKWNGKKLTTVKKAKGIPTCSHCKKKGHEESLCWNMHLKLQWKKFRDKGKHKNIASSHQDLGSNFGY